MPGHADVGKVFEAEVQDPHLLLELVRDRILETAEHVEIGFLRLVRQELAGGVVEVGARGLDGRRRTARHSSLGGVQTIGGQAAPVAVAVPINRERRERELEEG